MNFVKNIEKVFLICYHFKTVIKMSKENNLTEKQKEELAKAQEEKKSREKIFESLEYFSKRIQSEQKKN